jgi:hypothetical protein
MCFGRTYARVAAAAAVGSFTHPLAPHHTTHTIQNLILMMEPTTIVGAVIGSFLNKVRRIDESILMSGFGVRFLMRAVTVMPTADTRTYHPHPPTHPHTHTHADPIGLSLFSQHPHTSAH